MDDGLVETLEETGNSPTVKMILNLFSSLPTFPFYSLVLFLFFFFQILQKNFKVFFLEKIEISG